MLGMLGIGLPELIMIFLTGIGPLVIVAFLLAILWRIMKAQESMADSMQEIAQRLAGERTDSPNK